MHDMKQITRMIKIAALDAMEASSPVKILFGKVISITPLKITVDQKLILTAAQLVLTRNVVDYDLEMTVNHSTEETSGGSDDASFESHSHAYTGKKNFRVHNGLKIGEEVILIQMQGGQKFIVIEKVVKP